MTENLSSLAMHILDSIRKKRILGNPSPVVLVSNRALDRLIIDSGPAITYEIKEKGEIFTCRLFVAERTNNHHEDNEHWEVI